MSRLMLHARAGAVLALEILEEGSALYYPAATLRLLNRGLRTFDGGYDWDGRRFTSLLKALRREPDVAGEASRMVLERVAQEVLDPLRRGWEAWRVLVRACALGVEGAEALAEAAWRAPHTRHAGLLSGMGEEASSPWLARTIAADRTLGRSPRGLRVRFDAAEVDQAKHMIERLETRVRTTPGVDAVGAIVEEFVARQFKIC